MPRVSSIRDPVPLRDTATPHRGDAFPGPDGPTRHPAHSAVAGTGHGSARHGTGAGRKPARSGKGSRARRDVPRAPSVRATTSPAARTQGPARRDPPPTQRGEARATVGDERRSVPTAGTGGTLFSPSPRRKRELCLHASESDRYGSATTTQREAAGRGEYGTPQGTPLGPLEKAFSPRAGRTPTHPPVAPHRAAHGDARGHPGKGGGMRSTARGGKPEAPLNPAWVRGAPRSTASTTLPHRRAELLLGTHAQTPRRQPEEGAPGVGSTPPLGLGHLRDNPGRSRSTAKAQAEPTLAPPRRGQHDGPSGRAPPPPRRGGRPRNDRTRRRRGMPATSEDPAGPRQAENGGSTARSGRIPYPYTSRRKPHGRGGGEARGPRGRDERSGPIRHECPSLAHRGPVAARESVTSPHRSG